MSTPGRVSRARAGGKVILLGEHSVVYGSRALVFGLGRGAQASVHASNAIELTLGTQRYELPLESAAANDAAPARAFRALLAELGAPSLAAEAVLEIPAGAGLGSSAALGVALGRAASDWMRGAGLQPRGSLAAAALAWENVFHGNASGVDTAAAELGGCLSFARGDGARRVQLGCPVEIIVALVEPGASTRAMVEGVAARRSAEPLRIGALLDEIGGLVEQAERALQQGQLAELGRLMSHNQQLLVQLGVSSDRLDQACREAIANGALGAKLTGAGGGGCALALVDAECAGRVGAALERIGCTCFRELVA